MKKLIILAGIAACILQSCSKESTPGLVLIRITNRTSRPLTDVIIFSYSADGLARKEKGYGGVAPGSSSGYQFHRQVFSLPLFAFTMEGAGKFEVEDIRCGIGITYLDPGTYSLVISEENNNPYVRFIKD